MSDNTRMIERGEIQRERYLDRIHEGLRRVPIVALLGPRQCGKTTLARHVAAATASTYFDLESPSDARRLENAEYVLGRCEGLVVIDEVQLRPDLFAVLRVLADRPGNEARFLILGSASPSLVRGASESLAGRVEFVDLHGFDLTETGASCWESLWNRGGFPRSFLAASDQDSVAWREGLIRTYLQRDLPELGIHIASTTMRRFWTMLAHLHGGVWNASRIGRSLGVSDKTVRHYLDILTDTFMVRQLQPWQANLGKRQVRSPKLYIRDTGLLHALLGLPEMNAVLGHPVAGPSWEGFAIEHVMRVSGLADAYFWGTHGGAELDLLFLHRGRWQGVECKFTGEPGTTRSMRVALEDLGLARLWVVAPVAGRYELAPGICVCPPTEWTRDILDDW